MFFVVLGAIFSLMDERFSGTKHFWKCVADDRPKTIKMFQENIEKYKLEGSFSENETIENLTLLIGCFPFSRIISNNFIKKMELKGINSISNYNSELKFVWFLVRNFEVKKTKNR